MCEEAFRLHVILFLNFRIYKLSLGDVILNPKIAIISIKNGDIIELGFITIQNWQIHSFLSP